MQIRMDEKGRILFMATYVISDIHGEYERFMELLEEIDSAGLVLFHDPASQFLTGLHAFHGDDADAVAVFMNQKLH